MATSSKLEWLAKGAVSLAFAVNSATAAPTISPPKKPAASAAVQATVPNFFPEVRRPEFKPVVPRYGDSRVPANDEQKLAFLRWSLQTSIPPGVFMAFAEIETAGTMNPLAHAGENAPDGSLKKSGSRAAGLFQFIPPSWDRELNRSGQEFLDRMGYRPGMELKGNSLFQDKTYTDSQFLRILQAHIGRPADENQMPLKAASAEGLALRANLNLITFMKAKHSGDTLRLLGEANIRPTEWLGGLYEGHVFGGIRIHRAHRQGLGNVPAASLYPRAFSKSNDHLFNTGSGRPRTVSEAVNYMDNLIADRAAELEQKAYGRSFVETAADRTAAGLKRRFDPVTFFAANGQTVNLIPSLVFSRTDAAAFVGNVVATESELARKATNTPAALATASNLLMRLGLLPLREAQNPNAFKDALDDYRQQSGLYRRAGAEAYLDSSTKQHMAETDSRLLAYHKLQLEQAVALNREGAQNLNLRQLMKEQQTRGLSPERKNAIANQVVELKQSLIAGGNWDPPIARVKNPETGKREISIVPLTPARDGRIDNALLQAVERAQLQRGLSGNAGVLDDVTMRELPKPLAPHARPYMSLPVHSTPAPPATNTQRVSGQPSSTFTLMADSSPSISLENLRPSGEVSKSLVTFKPPVRPQ